MKCLSILVMVFKKPIASLSNVTGTLSATNVCWYSSYDFELIL